jgi:hypothetical protein
VIQAGLVAPARDGACVLWQNVWNEEHQAHCAVGKEATMLWAVGLIAWINFFLAFTAADSDC